MTDQSAATAQPRQQTTAQALAAFDAKQRNAAKRRGRPTDRSSIAGLFHASSTSIGRVIYTDTSDKIAVHDLRTSTSEPLTKSLLCRVITEAYDLGDTAADATVMAVFADHDTFRRVVRIANTWGRESDADEPRRIARLLAYRSSLPVSAYTPVLTQALATRYWLPAGYDEADLAAWDINFAHGHPLHSTGAFLALISRAMEGQGPDDCIRSITWAEKSGARSARYVSDHNANSAFRSAGTVNDAWDGMVSCDPALRERNSIGGSVSRIRLHQYKANRIEAYVPEPGRLREGDKIWIFDDTPDGRKVEVTLQSIEFVNEKLMAVLSAPNANNRNKFILDEALAMRRPLFAVAAPFLAVRKSPKNRRWTSSGPAEGSAATGKVLHVDVPVDIALAGAPVAD